MKQLTLVAENTLEWRDEPDLTLPAPLAALVRPVAVGVCDFDRALVTGRYKAIPLPIAVGHEIVADVVEVGTDVSTISVGMRIVLPLHVNCGACPNCRARRTNSCSSRPMFSNYGCGKPAGDWGGGMSDLLIVPFADAMAVPVPAGLTAADYAALGCNLVDLHRIMAPHLADFPEPRVLIVGGHAHNMALYGVVMARALGITRVDFMDDAAHRLAAAEALGARAIPLSEAKNSDLYDIGADCSGDLERLAVALGRLGPDGVCTPVWPSVGKAEIPVGAMFMRNARLITGQPHARAHMAPVLSLMQQGKLSSTSIPHEILPWTDAEKHFGAGETKRIFVRD